MMPYFKLWKFSTLIIAYLLCIMLLFPYVVMLITSLKSPSEVYNIPPTFLPTEWTFSNFVDIWQVIPLSTYILNTIWIAAGATIVALLCSMYYPGSILEVKGCTCIWFLSLKCFPRLCYWSVCIVSFTGWV